MRERKWLPALVVFILIFNLFGDVVVFPNTTGIIDNASVMVDAAEREKTQDSVLVARLMVNDLENSPEKDALTIRINAVQQYVDAMVATELAVSDGTQEAIDIAQSLVAALPTGADRTLLEQALLAAQAKADTERAVGLAEIGQSTATVDAAQALVNVLPESEEKDALNDRLAVVRSSIFSGGAGSGGEFWELTDPDNALVDVSIDPTISLSFDTNAIDFGITDPIVSVHEKPSALTMTVQSNYTYSITAKALGHFQSADGQSMIMADRLKAKSINTGMYLPMSVDIAVPVAENQPSTDGTSLDIDFRFDSDWMAKPGSYGLILRIAASQL